MNGALRLLMRGGAAAAAMAATFLQAAADPANLSTYTFASQNLGAAAADREIIIAVHGRSTATATINSVTVGGVTATLIRAQGTSGGASDSLPLALYRAEVPAGTTGSVVVVFSVSMSRCMIALWRISGGISSVSSNGNTNAGGGNSVPTSVTGVSGGVIIAAGFQDNAAGTTGPLSWTNLPTEDYDTVSENTDWGGGRSTAIGSTTMTLHTGQAGRTNKIVAAAFTP